MAQNLSHQIVRLNQSDLDPVRNRDCADVAVLIDLRMNDVVLQNEDAVQAAKGALAGAEEA